MFALLVDDSEVTPRRRANRGTGDFQTTEDQKLRPKSLIAAECEPKLITAANGPKKSLSFESLSLSVTEDHPEGSLLGNQFKETSTYLTSSEYLTPHPFDTDTDHTHRDDSSSDYFNQRFVLLYGSVYCIHPSANNVSRLCL